MRESTFNAELVVSLSHWGAWAYKIQDLPASLTFGLRYTPEKPCDIVAGYFGKFLAIEGKQIKKFEAFGLRHMEQAQINHLTEMVKKGNRAFVFLNIRIKADKGLKIKQENRLLIFDWKDFSQLKETLKQKEIMAHPYVGYQRVKKHEDDNGQIIYDLKPFLESL